VHTLSDAAPVLANIFAAAKKYGTEDSGAFINGILDSIYQKYAPLPSEKNNQTE